MILGAQVTDKGQLRLPDTDKEISPLKNGEFVFKKQLFLPKRKEDIAVGLNYGFIFTYSYPLEKDHDSLKNHIHSRLTCLTLEMAFLTLKCDVLPLSQYVPHEALEGSLPDSNGTWLFVPLAGPSADASMERDVLCSEGAIPSVDLRA